ncbi:MAG: hypothetical protein V2A61_00600 [Calditrichota bacterium]
MLIIPLYPSAGILPGYNDEPLHLHYIRTLSETASRPVYHPSAEAADSLTGEFMQPPLYYALAAPLWKLGESFHPGGGLFGARLVSLLCGLLAALLGYRAILLITNNYKLAVSAGSALLFAPNAVIFTSIVTNDALVMAFGALLFYSIARCQRESASSLRQVMSGLYLAAGVWSKLSALALFPLIWYVAPRNAPPKTQWSARLRAFLAATALILPLLAWNAIHYGHVLVNGGHPISTRYSPEAVMGEPGNAADHPLKAVKIMLRTAVQPLPEVWGSFIEKAASSVWLVWWIAVFIIGLIISIKSKSQDGLFLIAILGLTGAFIWRGFQTFQVEFRLFMPVFIALAAISARALTKMRIPLGMQVFLWVFPLVVLLII